MTVTTTPRPPRPRRRGPDRLRGVDLMQLIRLVDELEFIAARSGTVHVITPSVPPWMSEDQPAISSLPQDEQAAFLIAIALGTTPTLCGYTAKQRRGGNAKGDEPISCFADERLCASCRHVLGEMAYRAFEHSRPDDDEE